MDLNYQRGTTSGDEGLALLTELRAGRPDLPIVVMTAWGDIDLAVRAMRDGAQSFVEKPWDNRKLVQILEREIAAGKGARERSERHGREQRDALLIQRALMPPALPSTPRFEVAGAWQPAGTLGGDCYDVFLFGPDALGVSIADVAGKGLPAALLMSSLQAAVRAFAHAASSPQALCASVNRLLCGQMIAGRFVTMAYLRLDAARGTVAYANAGHNPPLLIRANGAVNRLESGGTVLGVFPDAHFAGGEVALESGDRLVLFTDGIVEAENARGDEFGDDRLADIVVRHRRAPASALVDGIFEQVTRFTTGPLQDDATVVVLAVQ
jgi:sigma-B regulation protein RsbU (phosphoserine phosphatase)